MSQEVCSCGEKLCPFYMTEYAINFIDSEYAGRLENYATEKLLLRFRKYNFIPRWLQIYFKFLEFFATHWAGGETPR